MKKNTILLFITICFWGNIFGQTNNEPGKEDSDYMESLRRGIIGRQYENPVEWYKGEQFYNSWTPGKIIYHDGTVIDGLKLRYEKYLDELLWLREDFETGIIKKSLIREFSLLYQSGELMAKFVVEQLRLPLEKEITSHYLQVLESGKISLYAFRTVEKSTSQLLLLDNVKYLISQQEGFEAVKLSRYSIMHIEGIDRIKMKQILKTNRLSVRKNETQFAKALHLYNN